MNENAVKEYFDKIVNIYIKYAEVIADTKYQHFHGLRDFYFMIKYICKEFKKKSTDILTEKQKEGIIMCGFKRNFGGIP